MKKADLKRLIKPIVKECIQESLLEDGVLSKVIFEVVMGLNSTNNLVKEEKNISRNSPVLERRESEGLQNARAERQQMLETLGLDAYNGVNLFEGTDPLNSAGTPGQPEGPSSPLAGVDAKDPGIDISSLAGAFGGTWKALGNG
jgi:hypothetical protein